MATNNKNLAAIIAEMHREDRPYGISLERLHYYADCLDAAAERERAIADALREALVEILDRTNREKARDYDAALKGGVLEIHDIANTALNQERTADALEKAPATGNAAALREALEQAKRDHWFEMSPELRNKIFAALATPVRNCDRFQSFDEALAEFNKTHESLKFCYSELHKWLFDTAE